MACKQFTAKEIESIIRKDGWYLTRICGSHHHYRHPIKPGLVTIPFHVKPKDLTKKDVASIFKQAQLDKKLYM